jgi:hypothetical protein
MMRECSEKFCGEKRYKVYGKGRDKDKGCLEAL